MKYWEAQAVVDAIDRRPPRSREFFNAFGLMSYDQYLEQYNTTKQQLDNERTEHAQG